MTDPSAARWQRIQSLLDDALELAPGLVEGFLSTECADDAELRREVESLLAACRRAGDFLAAPPLEMVSELLAGSQPAAPRTIGPYTILREVGRGGMGVVYAAERADVQKRVALKLVPGGIFSPARRLRFRLEQRVLARLEHAHIARLLDAGVTDEGTPWLAMEYVEGERIDNFCAQHQLNTQQRLALFEHVCSAVAHAHRNLVVHCDLKPSNILVTAEGEPRLVDFGIARLLADGDDAGAALTADVRPLTPDHASPEQLRGEAVTTASDIYQLGALLHQLLTGVAPRADRARSRIANRDIDTIVRKATESEPDRRYESAQQLRDDVRRHREGRPVSARAPTVAYRAHRFVARHRAGTAMAAVIVLLVLGSAGVALLQARRVARERDRAEQISVLLTDLFAGSDPTVAADSTLTLRTILDRGAERIGGASPLDPIVRARLLDVIAVAYRNLGALQRGIALEEVAVTTLRPAVPQDHAALLAAQRRLATWKAEAGHADEALAALRIVLQTERRRTPAPGRALADALHATAWAHQLNNQPDTARLLYDEALAIYRTLPADSAITMEATLTNLAALVEGRDDVARAEMLYRETLARRKARLGDAHPLSARSQVMLAGTLVRGGKIEEAQQLAAAALDVQRRLLPAPHRDLADNLSLHAALRQRAGQPAAAETYQREALSMVRALYGDRHIAVARSMADLGGIVQRQGRLDEAAQLQRDAAQRYAALTGPRSLPTGITLTNLAYTEFLRKKPEESERLYRQALPVLDSIWKGTSAMATLLADFATVLAQRGACNLAEPEARRSYELARTRWPENSPDVIRPQRILGQCLVRLGRYADAEPLLLAAHRTLLAGWGAANGFTVSAAQDLVALYERWNRPAQADRFRK